MPVVAVPPPFRGATQGEAEVDVEGRTVRECLDAVEGRFSGFRELVVDEGGRARGWAQIYVDEVPLGEQGLDASVEPSARIEIIASIGGG